MPFATQNHLDVLRYHLANTFERLTTPRPLYNGKVRDIVDKANELIMVVSDRVSAFDCVLGTVPLKGALLCSQTAFWLEKTREIIDNHLIEQIDPQALRIQKAKPFLIELVVRGFLAGSLLRESASTRGQKYGLKIDPQITSYGRFENPLITPTTKAALGFHDEPISYEAIIASGLASKTQLDQIYHAATSLFALGSVFAEKQGLLLVDTKYEFGLVGDKVILIDEIHTADSSRYWLSATYPQRIEANQLPDMLDKERLRRALLERGFDASQTSQPYPHPLLDDDLRLDLAMHYWQLTETLLGQPFVPPQTSAKERLSKLLN